VPFAYTEGGQGRKALVKLRLCPKCARKLAKCSDAGRPVHEDEDAGGLGDAAAAGGAGGRETRPDRSQGQRHDRE
jgi:hypothetical protein